MMMLSVDGRVAVRWSVPRAAVVCSEDDVVCRRTGRAGRHGFAYTFMSTSQGKYAGEIIKALELSSAAISEELSQLWDSYKKQAEAVMSLCVCVCVSVCLSVCVCACLLAVN